MIRGAFVEKLSQQTITINTPGDPEDECRNHPAYYAAEVYIGDREQFSVHQQDADRLAIHFGGIRLYRVVTGIEALAAFLAQGDIEGAMKTLTHVQELNKPFYDICENDLDYKMVDDRKLTMDELMQRRQ